MRDLGGVRFRSFSAGSRPSGNPHPDGLLELIRRGHEPGDVSSKSWDVFAGEGAPVMDIIVTVCASAAGETCPIWPQSRDKAAIQVHWGAEDPAHIEALYARQRAFADVYDLCRARILALIALPADDLKEIRSLQLIGDIT